MNEKSTVPSYYDMCVVSECPKASTCLHHVALPMTGEQNVRIYNPYLLDKTGKCPHYVKAEKVFHAKGFKNVMGKLPYNVHKQAVSALMSYFSERTYYRIRKGGPPALSQRAEGCTLHHCPPWIHRAVGV